MSAAGGPTEAPAGRLASAEGGDTGESFLRDTAVVDVASRDLGDLSTRIAAEIENQVFKVCERCRSAYGGGLERCPEDGQPLSEQSIHNRDTLFFDDRGLTTAALQLKKHCPGCRQHFPLHQKVCEMCGLTLEVPVLWGGAIPRPVSDKVNLLIADKYRLIEDIGAGGFGSVYLAKHESLGKRYAVKMLKAQISEATKFRDRFHEEALKLSRLEDENIVKVIDFGEWNDFQYMVTEYVDGRDLRALIYEEKAPPRRAAQIMKQVASALAEAHAKRIVHLDLKPANILITQKRGKDIVKVIDFGIAEIYSESRARRQECVAGTCTYMAPEQWRRDPIDPRSDIYSFGIIFYEFLAGRPPFRDHKITELEKAHCGAPPPLLHKLRLDTPPDLDKLIHRCLEKDPAKRIQSAGEIERRLDAYLRRTESPVARWLRRGAVAAAIGVALTAGAWLAHVFGSAPQPSVQALLDEVPAFTNRDSAELRIEKITGARARIVRRHASGPPWELDIESRNGSFRFSGTGATGQPQPAPGEPLRIAIPLAPGENIIEVLAEDHLHEPAEPPPGSRKTIEVLNAPLRLEPSVRAGDGVWELAAGKEWLSGKRDIEVEVRVADAGDRLPERAALRYRLKGERDARSSEWKPEEILRGAKVLQVALQEGGGNEIRIEPLADRYGNHSTAAVLSVFWDVEAPVLEVPRTISYFAEDLPRVVFRAADGYPAPGAEGLSLIDLASGRVLGAGEAAFQPLESGRWELRFLDRGLFPEDGRYRFRIIARDRAGNERRDATGNLDVLADHSPPGLEVLTQAIGSPFRRNDRVELEVRATDAFPEGLDVEARIAVHSPGREAVLKTFALDPGAAAGVYRGALRLEPGGIEKPDLFEDVEPRFEVTFLARDGSGREFRAARELRFAWENGDRLLWTKDGSVLIYHEACPTWNVPAFWLAERETTNRQFARFLAAQGGRYDLGNREHWDAEAAAALAGITGPRSEDWSAGRCREDRLDHPVRGVCWYEMAAYARWAGLKLPRRSHWLVAAFWDHDSSRERNYPWPGGWEPDGGKVLLWAGGKDAPIGVGEREEEFAASRSALGLRHLLGNVWELVLDDGAGEPVRVGGGFDTAEEVFRDEKTYRDYLRGGVSRRRPIGRREAEYNLGFRCAFWLEEK